MSSSRPRRCAAVAAAALVPTLVLLPGPVRAETPTPCSELDTSFTMTRFDAETRWDPEGRKTDGYAEVSVEVPGEGTLVVTGPGSHFPVDGSEQGPQTLVVGVEDEYPGDGRTQDSEYVLTYYPGGFYQSTCVMEDGTERNLGADGDFHGEPRTLDVTWFIAGQGARGSVDGVELPGSDTPHDVPSRTPVLTGPHRVARTDTCSVTVPEGEEGASYRFGWKADGKVVFGSKQTLVLTPELVGKTLTCVVVDNSMHGFPAQESKGFTVGAGTLTNTKLPKIFGDPRAGGAVALDYGKWAPDEASLKYRYQWYLGTKPIKGATRSNYLIPASAKGKKLACRMLVSAKGFEDASVMSKAVTVR